MATIEKYNIFNQLSIAAQIIDGSIKIESTAEFENVLQIFPNDPALLRAYGDRQEIPIKVHLQIHPQSNNEQPLSLAGYSRDISIGGIYVVLNSEYRSIPAFEDFVKNARVQISLPNDALSLNVKGTVIWSREINIEEESTIARGMRFQEMSPKARGMLLGFANSLEKFDDIN